MLNYFSDEGCRRLGEADADAIIAQFPKSTWLDYSSVFDANYYLSHYPDVAKATAGNSDLALDHFINYGMSEGRRGSASFDVQSYFNEYPDLRAAFGFDLVKYYEHYVTAGKAEGRHGTGCSKIEDTLRISMELIIHPSMIPHFIYRITKIFAALFLNEAPLAL